MDCLSAIVKPNRFETNKVVADVEKINGVPLVASDDLDEAKNSEIWAQDGQGLSSYVRFRSPSPQVHSHRAHHMSRLKVTQFCVTHVTFRLDIDTGGPLPKPQ